MTEKCRVPTAQAPKNPCQEKHREFGNGAITQGILFAQVVDSLIQKVKDIAIFFLGVCQVSFLCVCPYHESCKLAQGKFVGRDRGKNWENTWNLKMQFG